jgi:polyisoprenoid-binding protein YceI
MESQGVITKTKWSIDRDHSEIGFSVKHLMFSAVRGRFKEYQDQISTKGEDFSTSEINLLIKVASIDTNLEQRDQHLRSLDFFSADKFPDIRFSGDHMDQSNNEGQYLLHGELTIKGITRHIHLDVESGPQIKDPWGVEKALIRIKGKINRKDWGLNYNSILESGGVLISDEVWINCELELIKQD